MASTNKSGAKPRATAVKVASGAEDGTGETVPGINVRSFNPTFRRAGIEFTSEGRDFRREDLSEEQLEAIAAEPMLSVRAVELPALASDQPADSADADNNAGNE